MYAGTLLLRGIKRFSAGLSGDEASRYNLGCLEAQSGNIERAVKHWIIAASAGHYHAMYKLITFFKKGVVSRVLIDTALSAYNSSCAEMRSESRDAYIRAIILLLEVNIT